VAVDAGVQLTRSTAQHFLCDSGKLTRTLGWRPADPEASIGQSVRWHLAHPPESADTDFSADNQALAKT
jgi:nucleoside-diphosphate-sugar epimerase